MNYEIYIFYHIYSFVAFKHVIRLKWLKWSGVVGVRIIIKDVKWTVAVGCASHVIKPTVSVAFIGTPGSTKKLNKKINENTIKFFHF